ncbi:MAG TPA: phosphatase PAP2 family protein [Flavobacteriales bacterium]|nr:phosphatase PAP2 family protein [Flavobacteriales bacterium]|tara:strand:- start:43266 stop:43850 length:585 start_codon:yes stop_codon:yes gene_type:complete
MNFIEKIEEFDVSLFLWLNQFHSPFFDTLFGWITYKFTWIPLYALFLYLFIKQYRKQSVWLIIGAVLAVVLADQISVNAFKEVFQRYRPCHNLEIKNMVHIINNHCGGKYGFVSSHAANTFAIAVYMLKSLSFFHKKWKYLLIFWAVLVSYSRIYVGVHYPADVFAGALLGIACGYLAFAGAQFLMRKFNFDNS